MAKPLAVILKKYSDVIAGKLPASEVSDLTLGKEPGVDYAPKMADEREFVASHSVEKHPDRVGNGPDVYNGAKVKQAIDARHGHIPNPKSKNQYTQANEEVEALDENLKTLTNRYIGHKQRAYTHSHYGEDDASDEQHIKAAKVLNKIEDLHGPKAAENAQQKGLNAVYGTRNSRTKDYTVGKLKLKDKLGEEVEELDEVLDDSDKRLKYGMKAAGSYIKSSLIGDKNTKRKRLAGNKLYKKKVDAAGKKLVAKAKKLGEAKDNREYDYEGEMAVTKLKTICRHAEHLIEMMKPNTNLPEWVQSKIVKAEDYISTAHDYLMSEMNEAAKCNMSEAGTMCEVHGKGACPKEGKESDRANEMPMYNGKKDKEGKKVVLLDKDLQEKAESQAQQKLMAMALAYKRGEMKDASPQVKKLADSMTEKQLRDYAATKHKGLPKRVAKESADTPIKMPTNPSNQTADYNSGANLGNFTV